MVDTAKGCRTRHCEQDRAKSEVDSVVETRKGDRRILQHDEDMREVPQPQPSPDLATPKGQELQPGDIFRTSVLSTSMVQRLREAEEHQDQVGSKNDRRNPKAGRHIDVLGDWTSDQCSDMGTVRHKDNENAHVAATLMHEEEICDHCRADTHAGGSSDTNEEAGDEETAPCGGYGTGGVRCHTYGRDHQEDGSTAVAVGDGREEQGCDAGAEYGDVGDIAGCRDGLVEFLGERDEGCVDHCLSEWSEEGEVGDLKQDP